MNMKLYELTDNYRRILDMLDEGQDEALQDTLDSIKDAIEQKAEGIAKIIRTMDAEAEAIKAEEQRLNQRRKAIESRRDGLKRYLEDQLNLTGIDKVKTATFTVALQNNPPSVNVLDDTAIPQTFKVHIPEQWNVDKKAIMQALKDGQEIPGVELFQGRSLRIR
jgi:phage host-nuclease inhibitor protein Gam